jgi:hypothetical protein
MVLFLASIQFVYEAQEVNTRHRARDGSTTGKWHEGIVPEMKVDS